MTEQVTQNYQSMVSAANTAAQNGTPADGQSETEGELAELRSGERWSLTATERAYNAGGIENGVMTAGSPQQESQQQQ